MLNSAQPRPPPIIRSRTGCFTCRRRKKKCNEEKPLCSGCKRNKLECHWPSESGASGSTSQSGPPRPVDAVPSSAPVKTPSTPASAPAPIPTLVSPVISQPLPGHQSNLRPPDQNHGIEDEQIKGGVLGTPPYPGAPSPHYSSTNTPRTLLDSEMIDVDEDGQPPLPSPSSIGSTTSPETTLVSPQAAQDLGIWDALALNNNHVFSPDGFPVDIPKSMTLLPQHGPHSYDLLSYYLARTANSMGNGSTAINPFISKLIPLAFSSPLVLQLILAQSAGHRQASTKQLPSDEIAQRYYTDSLRMFRSVVDEHVSGKSENTLVLTVGSLILCLTEVARGDRHGTIFDHLIASKSLLTMLLSRPKSEMFGDLPDFLIEYYMHMAASSMISIDPHYNSKPLLSPEIQQLARVLVQKRYIGQLCGCWLELLLLIPQIFQLGERMLGAAKESSNAHSPENIINFGFLQSEVTAFCPDVSASQDSRLAGLVFKQGVLLYLWTILANPHQSESNSVYKSLVDGAVSEAIVLLGQFPAAIRVNTSLCWPLAVIGCCTSDPAVQQVLRERLQTMLDAIGLGNMRETLVLLEHAWKQPAQDLSPWNLYKLMHEHQIWISFA